MTDDQRADSLEFMPVVMDRLVDGGMLFQNSFVSTPLCAPSRASFLSGQLAHHHGVTGNDIRKFDPSTSIATLLQGAGYRTALIGKYLNYYYEVEATTPPGWDTWRVFRRSRYYDYELSEDGEIVQYGSDPTDYSTDVLAEMAVEFIRRNRHRPFFLLFTPWAPHPDAEPAPRHEGSLQGLQLRRPPSYNERDIDDKHTYVRWMRRIKTWQGPEALALRTLAEREEHLDQLESLRAVDDAVARILHALDRHGLDQETIVVFTSDNGLMWGEHWLEFKGSPFEESIRVPLAIRYPPLVRNRSEESRMVLNVDLTATLIELAGIERPADFDGQSLVGMLCGTDEPWRDTVPLEYFIPVSFDAMPSYRALRDERFKYVLYHSTALRYIGKDREELYDLAADPYELDNLLADDRVGVWYRAIADAMKERLAELHDE